LATGLGLIKRGRKISDRDRRGHDGQSQERPARTRSVALPEIPDTGRLRPHPDRRSGTKYLPGQQLHCDAQVDVDVDSVRLAFVRFVRMCQIMIKMHLPLFTKIITPLSSTLLYCYAVPLC